MGFLHMMNVDYNETARQELRNAGIVVHERTDHPKSEVPVTVSGFLVKNAELYLIFIAEHIAGKQKDIFHPEHEKNSNDLP